MRKILSLFCVLGIASAAWAETSPSSWANLSDLQAGQNIQVVDMNSKKHSGTFVNVSSAAITYQETTGEQTIQKQNVQRVKLIENRHRLRNALIGGGLGGGVGAGVGAGIGAATFHSCAAQQFCIQPVGKGAQTGLAALLGLAGGAVVGAVVGALWPSHTMVYRADSH
jgi:hypothetical protein